MSVADRHTIDIPFIGAACFSPVVGGDVQRDFVGGDEARLSLHEDHAARGGGHSGGSVRPCLRNEQSGVRRNEEGWHRVRQKRDGTEIGSEPNKVGYVDV